MLLHIHVFPGYAYEVNDPPVIAWPPGRVVAWQSARVDTRDLRPLGFTSLVVVYLMSGFMIEGTDRTHAADVNVLAAGSEKIVFADLSTKRQQVKVFNYSVKYCFGQEVRRGKGNHFLWSSLLVLRTAMGFSLCYTRVPRRKICFQ